MLVCCCSEEPWRPEGWHRFLLPKHASRSFSLWSAVCARMPPRGFSTEKIRVCYQCFKEKEHFADFLRKEKISILVDATHPFASNISALASWASGALSFPVFFVRRPPWREQAGDVWISASSLADAAVQVGGLQRKRVFVALGGLGGRTFLKAFQKLPYSSAGYRFWVRTMQARKDSQFAMPTQELVRTSTTSPNEELALLQTLQTEVLVARNAGGSSGYGKIAAARTLQIPVVLIRRPSLPHGCLAMSLKECAQQLRNIRTS